MESTMLKTNPLCPKCKSDLSGASNVSPGRVAPRDGDITVCIYCSTVLKFVEALSELKCVSDEEINQIEKEQPGFKKNLKVAKVIAGEVLKNKQKKDN